MLGLCFEGILYILMGEAGRLKSGIYNPGWILVVAGLSLFTIREREEMIKKS